MSNLLNIKGSRVKIYKTLPSDRVGNDGDIILSQIQGRGVYLCSKVNGKWHVSSKMEELRKIENTSTKDLTTNKLRVLDNLAVGRGTTTITKDEAKFSSSLKIKEASNAISDTVAYGQLWVKTATPNELYFTTDAGNDIQLTSGTTAAFVGDITSVVAGDGLTGGGTSSDVTLNVNVDDSTIETNSDALRIKDSGVTYAKIQNVTNARMLGNNSGGAAAPSEMTKANVLSFLGVADGAEVNVQADWNESSSGSDAFIANKPNVQYTSAISTGNNGLVPSAGTSGHFLKHDGTFGQVAYSNLSGTPTIPTNYITNDADDVMAGALAIDKDSTATTNGATKGLLIDYDHTGITASGQTITNVGLEISMLNNSVTHVGTHVNVGINSSVTSNTTGTSTIYGFYNSANTADNVYGIYNESTGAGTTGYGIYQKVDDGDTDYIQVSSANTADYFKMSTTANGATTLQTVDADAQLAHLTLISDGYINLEPGGEIIKIPGDIKLAFGTNSANDHIYADPDASELYISMNNSDVLTFMDDRIAAAVQLETKEIMLTEAASAVADRIGKGQLWVKSDTPNNLYFTDDTGQDIAITNNGSLAGIPTNYVTNDASDSMAGTLTSVIDFSGTSTASNSSFISDLNNTGNTGSGQTRTSIGFEVDYDYTGTNSNGGTTTLNGIKIASNTPACNLSTINNYGIVTVLTGDNSGSGTVRQTGLDFTLTGGSTAYQTGLLLNTDDGSTDIKIVSSADTGDYFSIATTTHGATTITTVDDDATAGHLTLDIDGDITLDADGGNIYFKDNGTTYAEIDASGIILDAGQAVNFNTIADTDKIYGDGDNILIAKDDTDIVEFKDDNIKSNVTLKIKEVASAIADSAAYGQIWVKDDTPNNLYFTNDAGNDVQITNGNSLAGGSGGTQCWTATIGGFSPNNSATNYYTQTYPNYYYWSNTDSSPSSISYLDSYAYAYKAPKDGTLTKICFTGRCTRTDPFKIYVYKYAWSTGDTSESGTLIGTSATITPPATNQAISSETTISSSNTFSAGDVLYVWIKKDSTTGSQNMYMAITIQGEYS